MGLKFCNCCGVDNECLIHSTVASKGKPWPTYSLASGTAPTETSTGFEFEADATIILDHDERFSWDTATSSFINDPYPPERKRLSFKATLNTSESSIKVTIFDSSEATNSIRFRSWTPTLAKYPILSAFYSHDWDETIVGGYWDFKGDNWKETEEHIVDRWVEGMEIAFQNSAYIGPAPSSSLAQGWAAGYSWDGNYAGDYTFVVFPNTRRVPVDGLYWPSDNEQITIEVTGEVTLTELELWHDPYTTVPVTDDGQNGQICPGEVDLGAIIPSSSQDVWLDPPVITGTIPHELLLTWPEMVDNPDYTGGSCAATCDTGSGTEFLLFRDVGTPGVGWEYSYGTESFLTYGCVATGDEWLYFNPIVTDHDAWVDAAVETNFGGVDTAVITEMDPDNHYSAHLTENGYCMAFNASVVYDHIETSPYLWWKTPDALSTSGVKCIMPAGTNVGIKLPDTFTLETI